MAFKADKLKNYFDNIPIYKNANLYFNYLNYEHITNLPTLLADSTIKVRDALKTS